MRTILGIWIFKRKPQIVRLIGNFTLQKNVQYFELHYFRDETQKSAPAHLITGRCGKKLIFLNCKIHEFAPKLRTFGSASA